MKRLFCLFTLIFACAAQAQNIVLRVDFRERPPEMHALDGQPGGPLVEVLQVAAERIGVSLEWRQVPFMRSLEDLRSGRIDLVPRVLQTEQRREFVHFLPSIGSQKLDIEFIVPSGREDSLQRYEDLSALTVGVKRGTAYFEPFDSDKSLHRLFASDDAQLAAMFHAGRLDAVAVLDRIPMEAELTAHGVETFAYARYAHRQVLGNYFGASLQRYRAGRKVIYDRLAVELERMRDSGEVGRIYQQHGLTPPSAQNP